MRKFFKVLSISALALAAHTAGHAAQVAELTVVSDKDPKAQWPLPLPPKR